MYSHLGGKLKRALLVIVLLVSFMQNAAADLFSPDRPVLVAETEFFTIIFTAESALAAHYLAGFADEEYREIAGLLDTIPRFRIPVVITPDSEELNGYFTEFPYLRIVMYQAPTDPDSMIGSYKDDLRKLFRHELTHAVSLTIRTRFEDMIAAVFGAPMSLSTYLAPMNFVEGVTVSLESLDGHGRATDPLAGAMIRQDLLEGINRTFTETAGAWDTYPGRTLYYIYGGYFSRYLQDRWGMAKYAELWKTFGAAALLRGLDDFLWVDGHMKKIYGVDLTEAWNDFLASMMPKTAVYMDSGILSTTSGISALAAFKDNLLYADSSRGAVFSYDTAKGTEKQLFRAGAWVSRLDASIDGLKVLVSTLRYEGDFPKLAIMEWDSATGRIVAVPAEKLRDAVYLRGDGPGTGAIIGVSTDGYETSLTLVQGGATTVLVRGSERINWTSPVSSADGTAIYALARIDGTAAVIRLDLEWTGSGSGAVCTVAKAWKLDVPPEISWIRYLSIDDEGVLRFSWDDSLLYRLAELDGNELSYQNIPISGGVHQALGIDGSVYHLGRFSDGTAVCGYPADRAALEYLQSETSWIDAPELLVTDSVYRSMPEMDTKQYNAARWLLPRFWLPNASLDEGGLVSAGAVLYLADPLERFTATIEADWDFRANAVDLAVSAVWSRFRVPLNIDVQDMFYAPLSGDTTRVSAAGLGIGDSYQYFNGGTLAWSADAYMTGYASVAAGSPAYTPWTSFFSSLETAIGWSDTISPLHDAEARKGYEATILSHLDWYPGLEYPQLGFEAGVNGYLETGAIAMQLFGAAAATGGIAYGPVGRSTENSYSFYASYPFWSEFASGESGPLYVEGEASFRMLGLEIQRGIGAFHVNRLSLRTGVRGYATINPSSSIWPSDYGWSGYGRATLTWTPAIGVWATLHPSSYVELWYRPDIEDTLIRTYGLTYMLVASY